MLNEVNAQPKCRILIDLNPVRAGLVNDPKDYRWSGYGEAVGGSVDARKGISGTLGPAARGSEEDERE